jgi:hypothetical protein
MQPLPRCCGEVGAKPITWSQMVTQVVLPHLGPQQAATQRSEALSSRCMQPCSSCQESTSTPLAAPAAAQRTAFLSLRISLHSRPPSASHTCTILVPTHADRLLALCRLLKGQSRSNDRHCFCTSMQTATSAVPKTGHLTHRQCRGARGASAMPLQLLFQSHS